MYNKEQEYFLGENMKKNNIFLMFICVLLSVVFVSCNDNPTDSKFDGVIRPNTTDTQGSDTIIDSNYKEDTQTNTDLDSNTDAGDMVDTNTNTTSDDGNLKPDVSKAVTVSFDSNGGDNIDNLEFFNGNEYSLPTPSKVGYEFDGWYYNDNLISLNGVWSISNDIELTARWVKQEYTISYNFNGGKASGGSYPQAYDIETNKLQIGVPQRDGYKFIGWQCGDTLDYRYKINAGSYGNLTLEAKWYKHEYTYQDKSGIQYLLKGDNTLSVVGYVGKVGNITIPYTYNDYTVTEIGQYAFCGYGDALATLSSSSFYRCDIPDTVTKIGIGAFEACEDFKVQLHYKSEITVDEWTSNLLIEERNDHVLDVINGKRPAIGWNKYWIPGQ